MKYLRRMMWSLALCCCPLSNAFVQTIRVRSPVLYANKQA